MAMQLRDLANNCIFTQAVTVQTVTTTTTGPTGANAQDFVQGDGLCTLLLNVKATSLTAVTVQVQQSTLTNSGFSDISGAYVSVTTDSVTGVSFQRDKRYLNAYVVLNGTTAVLSATLMEQYKVI